MLCQSNAADPHHEHPPAYTASFLPAQCVCEQVCGFLNSIPQQPVLYGITLDFSYSVLFFLIVDELLAHTLSYIINPPTPGSISSTSQTQYTQPGNVIVVPYEIFFLHFLQCPNSSSPFVLSCASEKVNYVGCFACCADF